jgi:hypothetical protein
VTEAVLSREMNAENEKLPFLSLEVDGNPLSPVNEARLEAFCLQAEKIYLSRHSSKAAMPLSA